MLRKAGGKPYLPVNRLNSDIDTSLRSLEDLKELASAS
jgi:hypothetical protein